MSIIPLPPCDEVNVNLFYSYYGEHSICLDHSSMVL